MKKILTLVAAVGLTFGAYAQRHIDWKIEVISPAEGSTVKLNSTNSADSITISYKFTNLGPDSINAFDTVQFYDGLTGGEFISVYLTDPTAVISQGETLTFNRGKFLPTAGEGFEFGPGDWCAAAYIYDSETDALMIEDDTTNNVDCNGVTYVNAALGLGDVNLTKLALNVFPNPANNQISFTNKFEATSVAIVKVTDLTGRVVKTMDLGKQNAGTKTYNVDIADLNNGMYYIELVTDETRGISKFTKN